VESVIAGIEDPALFRSIVEQAGDAVIVTDREGAIRVWNPRAEAMFGYTAGEVLGGSLDLIIPERLRAAHWEGFRRAVSTGTTKYTGRAMTTRSVHKDGKTLYVDLSFALLRDAADSVIGVLAIGRDGTERYLAEKALKARVSQLTSG
jgi:PAS domain S-box-containing protein